MMLIDTERYRDKADECRRLAQSPLSELLTAALDWEDMAELGERTLALESMVLGLLKVPKETMSVGPTGQSAPLT
jgi:hypothetical protein